MYFHKVSVCFFLNLILFNTISPNNKHPNILKNESIHINKITFESNVPFSKSEFFYLTNLSPNTQISQKEIHKAYKQLKNKKRFSHIDIEIIKDKEDNNLHFNLVANWIFKQLKISGIWFGKNQFEDLYLQHPGDIFNISLHEESIDAIKQLLHDQGYLNCSLRDELIYNPMDKTITAKAKIKRKSRFHIDNIDFKINNISQQEKLLLSHKLKKTFSELFINRHYSKHLVIKIKAQIKSVLKKLNFSQNKIQIKRLVKQNNKISLLFLIQVEPQTTFLFKKNSFFTSKEINKKTIDQEQPKWLLSPDIIAEQILHEYYKKGFWHATIHYEKIGTNNYEFTINENNRILIEKIIIKDIKTNKTEENKFFFNDILKQKTYDEEILNKCIEKLKTFYLKHGFWNFKIIDQQFIKNSNKYTILFIIQKETQKFLGPITINDPKNIISADFFKKYNDQSQSAIVPFNPYWLQEQKIQLLTALQQKGYWYANAQPKLKEVPKKETVCINWNIIPNEQVTFGKVLIRGSTKLPFNRILKELQFKEGMLWDRKKLEYSRKKLKDLDTFKYIQLQPIELSKQKGQKPIVITLLDDDPLEIRIRTGYFLTSKNFLLKRQSTIKIGGSLIIKNPLNYADKLSFNADFTKFERCFDFDYKIPRPFNTSTTGKLKAYAHKYTHPLEIGKSNSAYEAIQNGFLLGFENEYSPHCFWGLNIGNEWMQTSRIRGNIKLANNMINNTIPYFFIEPNIIIDRLDDKLQTTKGTLTFLSLKTMIPETNHRFTSEIFTSKIMFDHSYFYPIYKKIICALRIRWGHIFREKFEYIMPIERFYLGGPYTLRGYEKDSLPPLGKTTKINPNGSVSTEYTIQGGSSMLNGNFEIRFPIYKSFGGVFFQDVGTLSQSGFLGFTKKWYPTSGCGLRYQTPIGALRFDIGWKWKKSLPEDSSYTWYLTLGQAF